jgi:hypothetical protein
MPLFINEQKLSIANNEPAIHIVIPADFNS